MGILIDADAEREGFMEMIYEQLADDSDNIRANLIIDYYDNLPTVDAVPLSEIYRLIEGHSNYRGDSILATLTCVAEGKNVKPIKPVDAVPVVRGEWKRIGSGSLYDRYECTNCHRPPKWECLGDNNWRISFTDICSHCGADMRGEKND